MGERDSARLGYCDALRCLAALAVVLLHCAGATLALEDPGSTRFLVLNFLDGATRWAVPMFLMLTGAFLLDPRRDLNMKKWLGHLARVAVPLLIWGFLYAFYDTKGAHLGLEWFLEALIRMVKGELHYHLWYLPMLLGVYLLIPPMRALVQGSSRQGLWYLAGLWGVVTLGLNTLYAFFPDGLGRPWLNMLGLYGLSGYMGYVLLGYLLRTCAVERRWEWLCYALGLVGLVVTVGGTHLLSLRAGGLEGRLYGYLTPNVCFTALAIFLAARRLELGRSPMWAKAAQGTFGAYLLHPYLLHLLQEKGLPDPAWNVAWAVPLEALVLFAAALVVSLALRKLPKVGKYIC